MRRQDFKTSGGAIYSVALKLKAKVTGRSDVPAQEDILAFSSRADVDMEQGS